MFAGSPKPTLTHQQEEWTRERERHEERGDHIDPPMLHLETPGLDYHPQVGCDRTGQRVNEPQQSTLAG